MSLLLAGASACSTAAHDPGELRSDKQRITSPNASAADVKAISDGNTAFAADVYKQIRATTDNLFFSPLSISQALAMTWAGARTSTETQMATALHFTLPQSNTHAAMNQLDLDLASRGQGQKASDGTPFRLKIANAIWGQQDMTFLPSFLDVIAQNYGSGLRPMDFVTSPDLSRIAINDWVADKTEGKIKDLLQPGTIGTDTRLVLTNAVYFNAAWKDVFEETLTRDGNFTGRDGSTSTASFMHRGGNYKYFHGADFQSVSLPYAGDELSMTVILPNTGKLDDVEQNLGTAIAQISTGAQAAAVDLSLPKFGFDAELSLVETLSSLGMPEAFTDNADFSGLTGAKGLAISDVVHKAFIKVNEKGTEAAAATAVIVGVTSAPEYINVDVNRAFVFYIQDHATGAVLFLGRVGKI